MLEDQKEECCNVCLEYPRRGNLDTYRLCAIWSKLKLTGEGGLLLLRFRPHTVLLLIRNPDSVLSRERCHLYLRADVSVCHTSMSCWNADSDTQRSILPQATGNEENICLTLFLSVLVLSRQYFGVLILQIFEQQDILRIKIVLFCKMQMI